jgi:preprotein translocase subunit SecG
VNLILIDPTMGALIDVLQSFVFILFVLCGIVMSVVILLQEGKGGGLGGAFGGAAAETFGVKAGTISRFTAYLAAGFLGLALVYAGLSAATDQESMELAPTPIEGAPSDAIGSSDPAEEMPSEGTPAEGAPSEGAPEAPSDGSNGNGSEDGN